VVRGGEGWWAGRGSTTPPPSLSVDPPPPLCSYHHVLPRAAVPSATADAAVALMFEVATDPCTASAPAARARWAQLAARHARALRARLTLTLDWEKVAVAIEESLEAPPTVLAGPVVSQQLAAGLHALAAAARPRFAPGAATAIWARYGRLVSTADGAAFGALASLLTLLPAHGPGAAGADWGAIATGITVAASGVRGPQWDAAVLALLARVALGAPAGAVPFDALAPAWLQRSLDALDLPLASDRGARPASRPPPPRASTAFSLAGAGTGPGAAGRLVAAMVGTGTQAGPVDCGLDRLLAAVEVCAHPSNVARGGDAVADFLRGAARSLAKRVARDADSRPDRAPARAPPRAGAARAAAARLAVVAGAAVFSKNDALAGVAPAAFAELAWLAPAAALPLAARRFARAAAAGSDATFQLAAAADVLAAVVRPMVVLGLPPDFDPMSAAGRADAADASADAALDPERGAEFVRDALDALLPGLDANDGAKTLASLRVAVAALSSAPSPLPDDGDAPGDSPVPPGFVHALLDRVLALLDGLAGSDSASGDRAGGRGGGATFLLDASSALRPALERAFALAAPVARAAASARLARWAADGARAGVGAEAALVVNAAAAADPGAAGKTLVPALLAAAEAALPPPGSAPSKAGEAAATWALSLLAAALYRAGPAAAAHAARVRAVATAASSSTSDAMQRAASRLVASALAGLVGTYPAPSTVGAGAYVDLADVSGPDAPPAPAWHAPGESERAAAAVLLDDHLAGAATDLTVALAGGSRASTRGALLRAEGALLGGRTAVPDFEPTPSAAARCDVLVVAGASRPPLAPPGARAAFAAALVAAAASTALDPETLELVARVSDAALSHGASQHGEGTAQSRAADADAAFLAEPAVAASCRARGPAIPHRRLPCWLAVERVAAAAHWREGQRAWKGLWGGPTASAPAPARADLPPAWLSLLHAMLPLTTGSYARVRAASVRCVDDAIKRAPPALTRPLAHALATLARVGDAGEDGAATIGYAGEDGAATISPALAAALLHAASGAAPPPPDLPSAAEDGAAAGAAGLLRTQTLWRAACRSPDVAAATLAALVAGASRAASPGAADAVSAALGNHAIRFVRPPGADGDAAAAALDAALEAAAAAGGGGGGPHWRAASTVAAARLMLAPVASPAAAAASAATVLTSRFRAQRLTAGATLGLLCPRSAAATPPDPALADAVGGALSAPGWGEALLHALASDKPTPGDAGAPSGAAARVAAMMAAGPDVRLAELLSMVADVDYPPITRGGEPAWAGVGDGTFNPRAAAGVAAAARAAPAAAAAALRGVVPAAAIAVGDSDRPRSLAAADALAGLAAAGVGLTGGDAWVASALTAAFAAAPLDSTPTWAAALRFALCGVVADGSVDAVSALLAAVGPAPSAGPSLARTRWLQLATAAADEIASSGGLPRSARAPAGGAVAAATEPWLAAALAAASTALAGDCEPATRAAAASLAVAVAGPAVELGTRLKDPARAALAAAAQRAAAAVDRLTAARAADAASSLEATVADPADAAAVDAAAQLVLCALRARGGAYVRALAPCLATLSSRLGAVTDLQGMDALARDAASAAAGARTLALAPSDAAAFARILAAAASTGPAAARAFAIGGASSLWYRHAFLLGADDGGAVVQAAVGALADARRECADLAAAALAGYLQLAPADVATSLRNQLLAAETATRPARARAPPPPGRLAAVLGISALLAASPYAAPESLRPAIAAACGAASEADPVGAAARAAVAAFRKSHPRDADDEGALTADDWDALRDAASAGGGGYFV